MLGKKDYIDVKISHFPCFIHQSKGIIILLQKHMSHAHFLKLLLNKFTTDSLKKPCPAAKITENLKNILGVGRRFEQNIFPITALISLKSQNS